jgi:hypothetical protein
MNSFIMSALADARTDDLLRDAAHRRLVHAVAKTRRRPPACERLGWLLVEAGLRLSLSRRLGKV